MNISGQGHSLTFIQGHSDSAFSNFFSLETTGPIEATFHMEFLWVDDLINFWTNFVKFWQSYGSLTLSTILDISQTIWARALIFGILIGDEV